ncbi:MAG: hypothetical protein ACYDAG_03925 [Chloroflexota bacterium]
MGAALITKDLGDFPKMHKRWESSRGIHAGIVVCQEMEFGEADRRLERAARLLTPEAARNQLMNLNMFATEALAESYVIALTPLAE